ncbi:MAG: hypothetical protein P1U40_09545 [Coxiellaceae bacterium]|nr:hypothetical protein [Coxiellaceae bacterium]
MRITMTALLTALACTSTTLYAAPTTVFTTKLQASHYCPDVSQLTFTSDSEFRLSNGAITAYKNSSKFDSGIKQVMHPEYINKNHHITDAQFRSDHGIYGRKENNTITCNYDYATIFAYHYPLVLSTVLHS